MDFMFRAADGSDEVEISGDDLDRAAQFFGLPEFIPGRYSSLFVLDLVLLEGAFGINPYAVLDEVQQLEGEGRRTNTKPAQPFRHPPLRGLWHKHYFTARFLARNISDHLAGNKLSNLLNEMFDSATSETLDEGMVRQLAHRVTTEPYKARASARKLTGEWIVFAVHEGKNYYLTVTTHNTPDATTYSHIKAVCASEFPFLHDLFDAKN